MINAHKVLTLIFDKGFWDGKTLYKLKYKYGIDFIVPAKTDFISTKRLKKEAKEEDFKTINPGLKIKQVSALTDAPNYKGHLNAIVVKDKKSKKSAKIISPYMYILHPFHGKAPWRFTKRTDNVGRLKIMLSKNSASIGFWKTFTVRNIRLFAPISFFQSSCSISISYSNQNMEGVSKKNLWPQKEHRDFNPHM